MTTSSLSRRPDALDQLGRRARPKVTIYLVGQRQGVANSYTTLDRIQGEVTIEVEYEITFDKLEITFEGISQSKSSLLSR